VNDSHLRTERLQLIAATPELARAELRGIRHLGRLLGAHVPPTWPPPLNDEATLRWTVEFLEADPLNVGWGPWYFLHREHSGLEAVGIGGFRGRPDDQGTVEIGYSILPSHHRLGLASEAVTALVDWAFGQRGVECVTAHTLPSLVASIRVLEKCGFRAAGEGSEPGTLRFERVHARTGSQRTSQLRAR